MPSAETTHASALSLARWVAEQSMLFCDDDSPFRAAVEVGDERLVIVTGENASGKSLYVRVMAAVAQQQKAVPVSISIRERTGAGSHEMAGMRRVMMFGDEHEQSTGATSVGACVTAFKNLDREDGSVLFLDEPELGLSDGYARALGELIGRKAREIPPVCLGVVIVTHSRSLVAGIRDSFQGVPSHAAVGADAPAQAGLDAWQSAVEVRTVEELLALRDVGLDRWRRVGRLLKD